MKTAILISTAIILFLYMAQITISIHPFKISAEKPLWTIGWALIMIGVYLISYERYNQGEKHGIDLYEEAFKEYLQEKNKAKEL